MLIIHLNCLLHLIHFQVGIAVKCSINEKEVEGKPHFVITFERSSFEAGVAQQRLRVKLDSFRPGVVMDMDQHLNGKKAVGNGADRKAAEEAAAAVGGTGAFGQKQAMYANRHISSFIDVFRMAREREGGTVASCSKLLDDMITM